LGIDTTEASLAQLVTVQRKRQNQTAVPKSIQAKVDVAVEMLDNAIKDMTDMRAFLIATVEENKVLKAKLDGFKKLLGE
jgi:F0F1-type ATP synthase membrane subunit a